MTQLCLCVRTSILMQIKFFFKLGKRADHDIQPPLDFCNKYDIMQVRSQTDNEMINMNN